MEELKSEVMEGDENLSRESIPKSSSLSPKVTRPKLPVFAGSGGRSVSPRSKTDPGREDIKALMEDIMNLEKTDWKTFSRSRTTPRSKGKSISTNSSPSATPRVGSPVSEDAIATRSGLTRDRSRSLKILTDKLKNKNGKPPVPPAPPPKPPKQPVSIENDSVVMSKSLELMSMGNKCEQWTAQNIPPSGLPLGGSPRRSPDRRSMERTYEQIPESPEDVEQEESEERKSSMVAASSEESFRSVPDSMHDGQREQTPDSDFAIGQREKSPESDLGAELMTRSQEEFMQQSTSSADKYPEDEGVVAEIEEQSQPVVSTYIYHPIPRNSKFLQLAATKPPKRYPQERRSGITMISSRGRVGSMREEQRFSDNARSSEEHPRQRFQRRSDSGKVSSTQKSSPRFITHPTHAKASHSEEGSVDSNGFAALKSAAPDSEEELKKQSQSSLADSQFASEGCDSPTYQDMVESVISDGNEVSDRKNGKSVKQKSKSDPSGDRARDLLDFPQTLDTPQSHSAPLISKEEQEARRKDKSLMMVDEEVKQRSRSENYLTPHSSVGEEGVENQSSDEDESSEFRSTDHNLSDHDTLSPTSKSTKAIAISAPSTPHGPSPGRSAERPSNLLSVPPPSGPGRKPNIFRSASSASVLTGRKHGNNPAKDKDVVRKYSITTDEPIVNSKSSANLAPDFLPIGDTSNATSMPAVWNKDRLSSTDSPEREPGFIKVRFTILF